VSPTITIGGRRIQDGHPCFIIAEAGSNHDGKLDQALQLIDAAAEAGADAVKFQLFRAARLYPKSSGRSEYLNNPRSIYDIMAEMEMPYDWLPHLAARCRTGGVLFLGSVFDEESVDRLDPYVEAFKIASYEMTHLPLVRYVARKGKPVILSTGTADLDEVAETVDEFRRTGNERLVLMQCTAAYPAPLESLNVRAVATLKSAFGLPAGLSDHSRDPLVGPMAAVAAGANVIEKHYTLSNRLSGPDHRFAIEPDELRAMVTRIRETELALGSGEKTMHPMEKELREFARRSVFATRAIAVGEVFTRNNIAVLRCGTLRPGLAPRHWDELLGKRARRDIPAERSIQRDDVD